MRRRSWPLPIKILLGVLVGQFLSDWWWRQSQTGAVRDLPMRALALAVVMLGWFALRRWRTLPGRGLR